MQTQSLNSIVSKDLHILKTTNIFVVGDLILDSYIEGKVSRISPEAPAPILLESSKRYAPGGAGNVAANIASIGASVSICGRLGADIEAEILKEHLQKFGVNVDACFIEPKVPTTSKARIISYHEFTLNAQQLVRMDRESIQDIELNSHKKCISEFKNFVVANKNAALVLSDYGKGVLTKSLVQELIQIANTHSIPVIVDPKSFDVARYKNATVIKPNLSEGRALYKKSNSHSEFASLDDEVYYIAKHYLETSQTLNLVMSLSQHGVVALGKDVNSDSSFTPLHFPTKALEVADVSGAGDTLVAFLAMGLAAKLPISTSTSLGNIAAGIVCSKMGTAVVSIPELFEKFQVPEVKESQWPKQKVNSAEAVLCITQELQRAGKKIVFTNGCFDILHAGHVQYLQKAKSLGDVLIIGLNSDASIQKLKGESRPIHTFEDRANILAALECTDFVIEFTEDTPLNLIKKLKPNILVKGADYTVETVVGAKEVLGWGGQVELLEFLPGRSTSGILKKI